MPSDPARIMIVDDNDAIHHDFQQILDRSSRAAAAASLDDLERALGGDPAAALAPCAADYELAYVNQGEDAVRAVAQARGLDRPFACAFVDIRMPPGIDGIETVARMWQCQPELEVVLCSAFSDYSWEDIVRKLNPGDRLLVLRKPFDPMEVRQLAACLCEKWLRGRQLDDRLRNLEARVQAEVEERLRDRTRYEDEQRRSRRLEALGQLAAGLAHEINTPTQFASSNLEYLAEVLPTLGDALAEQRACLAGIARGELTVAAACARADRLGYADALVEAPKAIADARTGIARISRVVQSVRSHAHLRDRDCLVQVDVNEQVRSALELARSEYKHDADAVVELADVPRVMGDAGDLCLAILNLVINAAHAIHDKRSAGGPRGVLTVTTRCAEGQVEIAIRDTGGGIPCEIRDRVFEPFFTTKPIGRGTGQGLSIARATIVERHRGSLRFETETGKGTVFVIALPAVSERGAA
jgi:two-component system NtrC family sensor kinase